MSGQLNLELKLNTILYYEFRWKVGLSDKFWCSPSLPNPVCNKSSGASITV